MCWEREASRNLFKLAIMQLSRGDWWHPNNLLTLFTNNKKKKVKQSPHHFSWMKEKEQRFILSILSKPFNSEELNLILNELISADERRKVENYYRRLLKNPKACIVFATDGKTWGRQKHIWQNLEKLKTMFIKALLIHCYWFTVLCIPRAGKWSREKKA